MVFWVLWLAPFLSDFMAWLSGDQVQMLRVSWGSCAEVVSVLLGIKRDRRMVSVGPVFELRMYLALEYLVLAVCGVLSFLS